MIKPQIQITAEDAGKLQDLIWEFRHTQYRDSDYLKDLSAELSRATILEKQFISADVITMNSQALLEDVDTGEEMLYSLVYPEDADASQGKISILAPIGTAMLGFRTGDEFQWQTPGGTRTLRVVRVVYQPEKG